jgi:uncharacterized membrane protein YqgA involved in biofilm formation
VAAAAFASALGSGVLLSALSVAVVQGVLTVVGFLLGDLLDPAQTAALSATGGLLLLGVGFRLLRFREVPVGDLLPALVVAPVLVVVVRSLPSDVRSRPSGRERRDVPGAALLSGVVSACGVTASTGCG